MRIPIRVPRFSPWVQPRPVEDHDLLRFLVARKWNVAAAVEQFQARWLLFLLEILREMMICSLRKDRKVMNSKIWIYSFCMFLLFQGKCEENYDAICITDWPCHLQRGDPIGSTIKCIPETNPASDGVDTTKIMMNGCYSNCLVVSNTFFLMFHNIWDI